ncbi:unnamed protein product [Echinostoma caproni]|uniref:GIT domain-containing protein n=1 Tax=Echinostoma caproni TaxID=27848 RepID=A0A183BA08_9TREM|nr:unnamed protein product [Echinostoma caproni]
MPLAIAVVTKATAVSQVPSALQGLSKPHGFLLTRLRMLEQALVVEQALREVARAALSGGDGLPSPPLSRVQNLTVCLSNKLASAGPRKRIALPKDPYAREATRRAVMSLQDVLEDFYADLPGLPAFVVYTETDGNSMSNTDTDAMDDSHIVDNATGDTHDTLTRATARTSSPSITSRVRQPAQPSMFIEISDDEDNDVDHGGDNDGNPIHVRT